MADAERKRSFEAHDAAQRRAWLSRSYRERLAWLEEAKRFVREAMAASARRGRRSTSPPKEDDSR